MDWISIDVMKPCEGQEVMVTVEGQFGRYVWCDIYSKKDGFGCEWSGSARVVAWSPMPCGALCA